MKILILANSSLGLYNFRRELISELVKPGSYLEGKFHDSYEILSSIPNKEKNEDLKNIGSDVIITPMDRRGTNPIKDFGLILRYVNLIKKYNPDLVLTYTIKPNIYGGLAAQICRKNYISNITGLGTSLQKDNILSKIIKKMYFTGMKKVSNIFFQNEHNAKLFKDKIYDIKNYSIIPGSGINLNKFSFKEYPKKDKPLKFITIGRIMKDKGISELLEASKILKSKYGNNIEFNLVGSFDEDKFNDGIKELDSKGIINYLGFRNDVDKLIESNHCIIHPSYHEGMSNVLLEAGATGRPVIASNVPGCKETFIDGVSGYSVKARDSGDLVEKIEKFINLPYEDKAKMGLANRKHVEENFDRKIVVEEYLQCIEKYTN